MAIATVHSDAGHHELALRFNERIQRTHRHEGWHETLVPLLQSSYKAARALAKGPTAITSAIELLALGVQYASCLPLTSAARHGGNAEQIAASRAQLLEALEVRLKAATALTVQTLPGEGQAATIALDVPDMLPLRACECARLEAD